jgi:NADP-dependent 3-hydroxy acid dehydrogenase YdfG
VLVSGTYRSSSAVRGASLIDTFGAILPITLDVTDRDAVFAAVAWADQHFGRVDVVVNNAGYVLFGAV